MFIRIPVYKRDTISKTLALRQNNDGNGGGNNSHTWETVTIVIFVVLVVLLATIVVSYVVLRRLRASGKEPRFLPGSYLKRRWAAWAPRSKYAYVRSRNGSQDLNTTSTTYRGSEVEERAATQAAAAGVDRNTSVRSVMTLPAYSSHPKESEQVIGREGERGGMDTVVEYPETTGEEEARREEEMESLYQIRLARRRELEEREERRRERREARERGDWARLEELRRESRARALANNQSTTSLTASEQNATAASLIAEHQSRGRDRRVSSVAYGSLGQVRHDGTRLRANSNDSESGGLLAGAAPMGEGEGQGRLRGNSDAASMYSNLPAPHLRQRSDSSALSISTTASDLDQSIRHTTASAQADDRRTHSSQSNGTSSSSPNVNRYTPDDSTGSDDFIEVQPPPPTGSSESRIASDSQSLPPDYDALDWGEAPAYTEAELQARRASLRMSNNGIPQRLLTNPPRLPDLELPSINVETATEPNTPITPHANASSTSNDQRH